MSKQDSQGINAVVYRRGYSPKSVGRARRAAAMPATKSLFDIDPNAAKLSTSEFERFRSVVCKLLYVSLRGWLNILLAVVFIASRVSKATLQDQTKLKRLLEYLYGTYDLTFNVGCRRHPNNVYFC